MNSTKDRIVTVYCPFSALKTIAETLTKATVDAETRAGALRKLNANPERYHSSQLVENVDDAPKYDNDAALYKYAQGLAFGLLTCAEYDVPFWTDDDGHGAYFAGEEYPAVAQAEPF